MIGPRTPLLLASRSPRRGAILDTLGLPWRPLAIDVDESSRAGESSEEYVARVVGAKADAAWSARGAEPCAAILVADTVVTWSGRILGKPESDEDAFETLRALAGRTHRVLTRFGVVRADGARRERTVETRVTFRAAGDDALRRYVRTGEGRDKAGAYAVQGLGSFLVERLEGSYTNVVGLPACELILALEELALLGDYP